jgi:(E)-4-hydroxy-3-methylbut-2-enyl-diphosphate synthase
MITREIQIGNLALGGKNPVRIQSMTNTNTMDTLATVNQVLELVAAGCEMVRITARNKAEAENLQNIKDELLRKGCSVPLIADIHFQPEAAEVAARIVEKVRINPGNYIDKNKAGKAKTSYTENEYREELEKIRLRLLPLIRICKEHGTAIRVGVNHGSLSERITSRNGDTPEGMVVSALEYIEMFAAENFHNLVLSMKSSDVKTMIYSYRLLAARMSEKGYDYPLHLGVTEAGAGDDARIKSAAGIGELLMEGLGDTIRVSLTEDPVKEIEVARILCERFKDYRTFNGDRYLKSYIFQKAETNILKGIGSNNPPVTILGKIMADPASEFIPDYYQDIRKDILIKNDNSEILPFILTEADKFDPENWIQDDLKVILYSISFCNDMHEARNKLIAFRNSGNTQPIILCKYYDDFGFDELLVSASAEFAFFLTDGLVNGICIHAENFKDLLPGLMFSILQAMGLRRIKAEFIACPTCGRTSYDVEGTLKAISVKLSHLKHLKIAVMGCIVNGPGEMADADYGYVGSSANKVNLYKGKTLVSKNIDESSALNELISIIKENGDWREA